MALSSLKIPFRYQNAPVNWYAAGPRHSMPCVIDKSGHVERKNAQTLEITNKFYWCTKWKSMFGRRKKKNAITLYGYVGAADKYGNYCDLHCAHAAYARPPQSIYASPANALNAQHTLEPTALPRVHLARRSCAGHSTRLRRFVVTFNPRACAAPHSESMCLCARLPVYVRCEHGDNATCLSSQ